MSESVYSSEDGMEYVVAPTNTLKKGSVFCEVGNNFGMGIGLIEYNAFDEIVAKVNLQLTDLYPNAIGSLYRVARRNKKLLHLCCHLCKKGSTRFYF
jgi:hypothetical protein